MTKDEMAVIGRRYGIHPFYRKEFLKLANEGVINHDGFGARLCTCTNYAQACRAIMLLIGRKKHAA